MVSEVMLQQTQVERVVPFYKAFTKRFPTPESLAAAGLAEVLKVWSGLGYNRRGKMLRDAARTVVEKYDGKLPRTAEEIETLSGIGPYTARAIATFAYNSLEIFIETNIRTVFLHHCFSKDRLQKSILPQTSRPRLDVTDVELIPLVEATFKRSKMEPREFYAMLMDYGSFLKKSGVKLNSKSKHYTKQSKFQGSRRQLRGAILRLLLEKPLSITTMIYHSGREPLEVKEELVRLEKEKLIVQKNKKYSIAM